MATAPHQVVEGATMQATTVEVLVWLGTITFAATGALAALDTVD